MGEPTLNRILAATDFSPAADRAVLRAAMIARQQGAELHVLHVTPMLSLYPGVEIGPETEQGDIASQLDALVRVIQESYEVQVHTAQRIGRPHRQIAEYADAEGVDLVVAGARGENTALQLLMGSTAWRLLRVCRIPVLVVRQAPMAAYRRPLAAVDFFPHTGAVVDWAKRLSANGEMDVLHVLEAEDESGHLLGSMIRERNEEMRVIAENLMTNLMAGLSQEAASHIEVGYPPVVILERAANWRTELIVVGRHGRGGLEAFLLGSVSKDVVQAAECDVLVV